MQITLTEFTHIWYSYHDRFLNCAVRAPLPSINTRHSHGHPDDAFSGYGVIIILITIPSKRFSVLFQMLLILSHTDTNKTLIGHFPFRKPECNW